MRIDRWLATAFGVAMLLVWPGCSRSGGGGVLATADGAGLDAWMGSQSTPEIYGGYLVWNVGTEPLSIVDVEFDVREGELLVTDVAIVDDPRRAFATFDVLFGAIGDHFEGAVPIEDYVLEPGGQDPSAGPPPLVVIQYERRSPTEDAYVRGAIITYSTGQSTAELAIDQIGFVSCAPTTPENACGEEQAHLHFSNQD